MRREKKVFQLRDGVNGDTRKPIGSRLRGALVQEGNSGSERGSALDLWHQRSFQELGRDDPSIEEESGRYMFMQQLSGNETGVLHRENCQIINYHQHVHIGRERCIYEYLEYIIAADVKDEGSLGGAG